MFSLSLLTPVVVGVVVVVVAIDFLLVVLALDLGFGSSSSQETSSRLLFRSAFFAIVFTFSWSAVVVDATIVCNREPKEWGVSLGFERDRATPQHHARTLLDLTRQ